LSLEPEQTATAAAKNRAAVLEALGDLDSTGGEIVFRGGAHFTEGFETSSRIMLRGESENGPITFHPSTPGARFFLWQRRRFDGEGVQIPNPLGNSELQLEACGFRDLVLLGNRQTRGHGFEMRGVDHAVISNSQVRGIAGTAVNLQHVREYQIYGYYGRYNGYVDADNPAIMAPGFLWGGTVYAPFEESNLSTFHGVQEAFTFGVPMVINGAIKNSIIGGLLHMLAPQNTSLEDIVVALYGGARGWDASGNPRNQLAALLAGAPNVANVSGRRMKRGFAACPTLLVTGQATGIQLDQVNFIGSSGMHLVRADEGSDLTIGQGAFNAASAARFAVTADVGANLFTVTSILAGVIAQVPETGTPGEFTALSSSPLPIVSGARVYVIRVSDTTFRLAASYADAKAGTPITITAAGGALEFSCGGQMLYATDGSEICVDTTTQFNDGYSIAQADEASTITSRKLAGTTFAIGPSIPSTDGELLLFSGRNISLNSSSVDYTLRKVFRGSRFIPTRVQVIRRAGGATGVSGNLQIRNVTGGSGGTALLSAAQALTGLTAQNMVLEVDTAATSGVRTSLTSQLLYARMDAGSGQDYFRFDVRVYGRVVD